MNSAQPPVIPTPARRRLSLFLKVASICLLIVLLLIPLGMTHGVLRERQGYQAQADNEIAETWGQSQMVSGPVLVVPWVRTATRLRAVAGPDGKTVNQEESYTLTGSIYSLPDVLAVDGRIEPEVRYRGIYESIVYAVGFRLSGKFLPEVPADSLPRQSITGTRRGSISAPRIFGACGRIQRCNGRERIVRWNPTSGWMPVAWGSWPR